MTPGLWLSTKTSLGALPITIASGFMSASMRRTTPDKLPFCESACLAQSRAATDPARLGAGWFGELREQISRPPLAGFLCAPALRSGAYTLGCFVGQQHKG